MSTTKKIRKIEVFTEEEARERAAHWARNVRFTGIPGRMIEGMMSYVLRGRATGGFLEALFSNDLIETFNRADDENVRAIRTYAAWLYNEAPTGCWGSKEKVASWKAYGGLEGGA